MTYPEPTGSPLPPWDGFPHTVMLPSDPTAAKALLVEYTSLKLPVIAPLPPYDESPHAYMLPSWLRAAKARSVA
mgnify:CR=1 FL=1